MLTTRPKPMYVISRIHHRKYNGRKIILIIPCSPANHTSDCGLALGKVDPKKKVNKVKKLSYYKIYICNLT